MIVKLGWRGAIVEERTPEVGERAPIVIFKIVIQSARHARRTILIDIVDFGVRGLAAWELMNERTIRNHSATRRVLDVRGLSEIVSTGEIIEHVRHACKRTRL